MSVLSPEPGVAPPATLSAPASGGRQAPACPLCGASSPSTVSTVTPGQLLQAWKVVGASLSPEAMGDLLTEDRIRLWQCHQCGFEYSHLQQAGGARFYEELQAQIPTYYPTDSPEYSRAIAFANEHGLKEVLDVGCGAGAFLNLAQQAGLQTYGVELNPKGAAVAKEAGHTVYNELLSTMIARGDYRQFEMVTTWQVLEHVEDPIGFLRDCARFVKPGGYLAVAVPTEDGINSLCPYNPHVWPPHHVTRWRLRHLRQAGEKVGLTFVRGGNDELNPYNARYMWELDNALARTFDYRPKPGGRLLPKLLGAIAGRSGLSKVLPDWGYSTYAFFRAAP